MTAALVVLGLAAVVLAAASVRIVREYERAVVFRLGRLLPVRGPGLVRLIAQTTLRSVLGGADLDELLSERERLNEQLRRIIDEQTEPWGVKVATVEIKDVEIPEAMQRAMARQAEAERERRAKIINADGEFQAAERLASAGAILGREPSAMQLRYLQTLLEVSAGPSSTIVFPPALDLLEPFLRPSSRVSSNGEAVAPGPGPS